VKEVVDREIRKGNSGGVTICRVLNETPGMAGLYTPTQIYNYIGRNKEKVTNLPTRMNLIDLHEFCIDHSEVPVGVDEPYVVNYHVDINQENQQDPTFGIAVSTKRLLRDVNKTNYVNADGTYKTNWNGFPFVIIGSCDKKRTFHPLITTLTSNEKHHDYQ
jgi:hypothetical protein